MGFDQYHEPPGELPEETRTFARLCASLTEEAEAIGWYEQRLSVERNPVARAVMLNAMGEEYKHFAMDLEYLFRQKPQWREIARGILFREGDIVENGEASEEAVRVEENLTVEVEPSPGVPAQALPAGGTETRPGSLGIGSLRGEGS